MAENHQPVEAPADVPVAAQASTTPDQPSAAHQPADPTTQATGGYYAQYPNAYGQPYQSYQQYGYNQAAYTQPQTGYYPQTIPAPPAPENKFRATTKSGLHALAVVLSIAGLGMALSFISADESYLAAIGSPIPVMALIWSASELTVRAVHKWQSGIHPGGQVAACLILWLSAAIIGSFEAIYSSVSHVYGDCDYDDRYYSEDCDDNWSSKRALWIAISAITCLLFVIYFVLFVIACIDTSKHNAAKRFVMVVNPASYWGPPAQGWQQLPQQAGAPSQQQQPQQQGQYMAVPQPVMTRASANPEELQEISLQDRTPSPMTTYDTPGEVTSEKGKGPERAGPSHQQGGYNVHEYYTPSGANN